MKKGKRKEGKEGTNWPCVFSRPFSDMSVGDMSEFFDVSPANTSKNYDLSKWHVKKLIFFF
jgi:hypothetical protein